MKLLPLEHATEGMTLSRDEKEMVQMWIQREMKATKTKAGTRVLKSAVYRDSNTFGLEIIPVGQGLVELVVRL